MMRPIKLFIYSAGSILLVSALIRFVIATGHAKVLLLPEPILGIQLRYAVVMVGIFELAVAMICLFGKRPGIQLGWLAWLSTNFIIYSAGLFTMHCHPQTSCIGSLTDPLHLSGGIAGSVIEYAPLYLLLGSYVGLLWPWLAKGGGFVVHVTGKFGRGGSRLTPELLKMSCPACGVHIKFARQNVGQKIPCPQCQKNIKLRKPDMLKMACFFCQEHIEFPPHAIGEKMPCPHCKMDITLKEPI